VFVSLVGEGFEADENTLIDYSSTNS
jgi:hypothetical protein